MAADGKFATAKKLVPKCLGSCDLVTICRFFHKTWHYMDAYACVESFFFSPNKCSLPSSFTVKASVGSRLNMLYTSISLIGQLTSVYMTRFAFFF